MPISILLQRPRWLAAIGLGAMAVIALGYLLLAYLVHLPPFPEQPVSRANIQIVLDRSFAMEEPFGDGTKMEAAIRAIDDKILREEVATSSNLSFRQFGGSCDGDNSQLVVGFGANNQQRVRSALGDLDVGGDTTFVNGISQAIRDFGEADGMADGPNEIIVIAGGDDSCQLEDAAPRIRREIDQLGVQVTIRFIGLDVPDDQRQGFNQVAFAISGEPPIYVTSPIELDEKLTQVM